MMRGKIGILSTAAHESGGIYQYSLSLLEALAISPRKNDYVQLRTADFPQILPNSVEIPKTRAGMSLKLRRLVFGVTGFRIGNLIGEYDLPEIRELSAVISPIISLVPGYIGKPYLVTLHDFQHKYFPGFFPLKERLRRAVLYRSGIYASGVICESNYVKLDITKYLGISGERVEILPSPPPRYIYEGGLRPNGAVVNLKKYGLPYKYLLYPAQYLPHKNHGNLLLALARLRSKYGLNVSVALTGAPRYGFSKVLRQITQLRLEGQVFPLGYVPSEDMPALYRSAIALVMPTLFESISIPIWEAFALGCPVLCSNVCALPEQVGDAGVVFDPFSVDDIAEKILKVWEDGSLRIAISAKARAKVANFNLESYGREWERVIASLLFKGSHVE